MKTRLSLTPIILFIFLLAIIIGRCTNPSRAVTGTCKASKGFTDNLWNCDKGDCTGTCMLQVRHITPTTPADTVWKDVPGGNLNDEDLKKEKQEVRCDCR